MTAAAVITGAAVLTGTAVVTGAATVTEEAMVNEAAVVVLPTNHSSPKIDNFLQQVVVFANK